MKFFFSIMLLHSLHATNFQNDSIEIELPRGWGCQKFKAQHLCRQGGQLSKEAFISLNTKLKAPKENLQHFEKIFKTPLTTIKIERVTLNDHPWVKSVHLGRELKRYYTTYVATVKGDLAILVALNTHKDFYPKYRDVFEKMILSLKVRDNDFSKIPEAFSTQFPQNSALNAHTSPDGSLVVIEETSEFALKSENRTTLYIVIALGLGLVTALGFFLMKVYKKK